VHAPLAASRGAGGIGNGGGVHAVASGRGPGGLAHFRRAAETNTAADSPPAPASAGNDPLPPVSGPVVAPVAPLQLPPLSSPWAPPPLAPAPLPSRSPRPRSADMARSRKQERQKRERERLLHARSNPAPPVTLLTYADRVGPGLCTYLLSAVAMGWRRIVVLGVQTEDMMSMRIPQLQTGEYHMGKRLNAIRSFLLSSRASGARGAGAALRAKEGAQERDADRPVPSPSPDPGGLFLFSDGFDVVVQGTPADAVGAFAYYNGTAPIIYATENDCWPPEFEPNYPTPPPDAVYRHLNGGGWIGTREGALALLRRAMAAAPSHVLHELVYNEAGDITGDGYAAPPDGFTIALPPCVGVDTSTWDVYRVCPGHGPGITQLMDGSNSVVEPRASRAVQIPESVVSYPTRLTVPGFLRRNDQIVLAQIFMERPGSDGGGGEGELLRPNMTIDYHLRVFQSMQLDSAQLRLARPPVPARASTFVVVIKDRAQQDTGAIIAFGGCESGGCGGGRWCATCRLCGLSSVLSVPRRPPQRQIRFCSLARPLQRPCKAHHRERWCVDGARGQGDARTRAEGLSRPPRQGVRCPLC
jgi:hypothetical protein